MAKESTPASRHDSSSEQLGNALQKQK